MIKTLNSIRGIFKWIFILLRSFEIKHGTFAITYKNYQKNQKTNLSPKWLYKDINQTATNNNNHLKMSKKQTSN